MNGFIKNFADIFTFSRASGGGRINALGAFEWVAANQPRIDHNPVNLAAGTGPQTISLPKDRVFAVTIIGGGTVAITGTGVDLKYMGPSSGTIRTLPGTGNADITFTPSGTVTAVHVREVRGPLIEEQRTNCITNGVLAGAGVGSWPSGWWADAAPSGLTVSVLGTGTEAGLNYVDIRINGTPASGGQWQVAIGAGYAATNANPWTLSIFSKLQAGSMANVSNPRISINYVNSSWSYIGENGSTINTGVGSLAAQRAVISATPVATTANIIPYFKVSFSAGQAMDVTFRLAMPQLEQGSLPTSAIPTSGSQVTRAADKPPVNVGQWLKSQQGTLYVEYSDDCAVSSTLAQLSSGDGGAAIWIVRGASGVNCMVNNAGLYRSAPATGLVKSAHKAAVTWDAAGNFSACCDGQAVAINTQPNGSPVVTGGLHIGCDNLVAAWANGHIRAAKYLTATRTAEQLKALTA